jgi:flavin reductase (DIM6/NTAB) family NADH-FMN oxidoreductase RutF
VRNDRRDRDDTSKVPLSGRRESAYAAARVEHEAIDPAAMPAREVYQLMIDLVAPRPIAWVSTLAADGKPNLAPFSYYQGVCSRPPTIVLGIAWRSDGTPKDTLVNVLATGEFTVNHVRREHAEAMNLTSGDHPPDVDEWDLVARAGVATLTREASSRVAPPRIAEANAALECRLVHAIPLGRGRGSSPSSTLVVAEVAMFWVARTLVERDDRGRLRPLDPARLASIGRLGGIAYTGTTDTFAMPRPKVGSEGS